MKQSLFLKMTLIKSLLNTSDKMLNIGEKYDP